MANIKSAIKRIRTSRRNETRNKSVKSAIGTLLKKANSFITSKKKEAGDVVKDAIKSIDKAVSKGILHKKTASRKKSRLMKNLNKGKK